MQRIPRKVADHMDRSPEQRRRAMVRSVLSAAAMVLAAAGVSMAAQRLIASQPGNNLVVDLNDLTVQIDFGTVSEPVSGIGFAGDWTAIVADQANGIRPWSTDMIIRANAPDGQLVKTWGTPIGGDRTIADYPFQDATANTIAPVSGSGVWNFTVDSGNPAPFVIGLNNVSWHLLTEAPDVVSTYQFSVADGPEWNRPFFIAGISGLGPVFYRVLEFQVETAGLYRFNSVVSNGNAFTFLYQDSFDPDDQLTNLLDYGLGNGNAPNGAPAGTSLIEALLFEGQTYYFVVSQWDRFTPNQSYNSTITGPGSLTDPLTPCLGDLNNDSVVNADDLSVLLASFGNSANGDLNNDGTTDADDLGLLLSLFGNQCG